MRASIEIHTVAALQGAPVLLMYYSLWARCRTAQFKVDVCVAAI